MGISLKEAMSRQLAVSLEREAQHTDNRRRIVGHREGRHEAFTRCIAIVTALGRVDSTGLADTSEVIAWMEKERDE